jgi:hypothetical protein
MQKYDKIKSISFYDKGKKKKRVLRSKTKRCVMMYVRGLCEWVGFVEEEGRRKNLFFDHRFDAMRCDDRS